MKILFYVEPHPIRNSFLHFRDVARKFATFANSIPNIDCRIFANEQILEGVLSKKIIDESKIIFPTKQESDLFSMYNMDWESVGQNIWLDLLQGGGIAESYLPILRRIFNIFPFDIIVSWGENGALRLFQKEHPCTVIGMELGCTRPPFWDSLAMDPYGTNGASIVPKLDIEEIANIVNRESLSSDEAIFLYNNREILAYEQQFLPVHQDFFLKLSQKKPRVFLPLQLFDDANLLRFSSYSSITDVVQDVVPKLVENGYQVLIKPHPAEKIRHGAVHANRLAYAALSPWLEDIVWCNQPEINYNNIQLMQLSDFVVTVNSSVGFEALFYDKPCVVLGEAIYKPKNLFPTLEDMLRGNFDFQQYKINIGYLRRFFLEGYLMDADIWANPSLLLEKISLMHKAYKDNSDDYKKIASEIFSFSTKVENYRKNMPFNVQNIISESFRSRAKSSVVLHNSKEDFLAIATEKLIELSKAKEQNTFSQWLKEKIEQTDARYDIFKVINFVDKQHYLGHQDVKEAGIEPIKHYTEYGIYEKRTPNKFISAGTGLSEIIELFEEKSEIYFAHDAKSKHVEMPADISSSPRDVQLWEIGTKLKKSKHRIAVIAHLYYKNLIPEFLYYLNNIKENFDLIVTMPNWGREDIIFQVKQQYPDALFYSSDNHGKDIGPFIDILPILLEKKYTCCLKLHTKNEFFDSNENLLLDYSAIWRQDTFNALLGSTKRIQAIISSFQESNKIKMIGAKPFFYSLLDYPYSDDGEFSRALGISTDSSNDSFFAGSMFWFVPEAFTPLIKNINPSILSFMKEQEFTNFELDNIIEKIFGQLASSCGLIAGVDVDLSKESKIDTYLSINKKSVSQYCESRKNTANELAKMNLIKKYNIRY